MRTGRQYDGTGVPGYDDVWKYRALEREWRYVSGTQLVFIQTVLAPPYPKCIIL